MIPRVTTRGYYNRTNGDTISTKRYSLYPPNLLRILVDSPEVCIMVHGMRNDSAGAASKIRIAADKLALLGYEYPVIGFSYDSNVKGANTQRYRTQAIGTAKVIATKNGFHLKEFILDIHKRCAVRLMGHSLGSEVICSAILQLYTSRVYDSIESVHLFGASVERGAVIDLYKMMMERVVRGRVLNYHWPDDEVLGEGVVDGQSSPVGLRGTGGTGQWQDIQVRPANHRFASYAQTLDSFP